MRGGLERLGPFSYRWQAGQFPLGEDSLELAEFPRLRPGTRVCDLGCGPGALMLLLARRQAGLELTGVELDPGAAEQARENLRENGLPGRVITGDLAESRRLLPPGRTDLVISNPPYFAPEEGGVAAGSRGLARSGLACGPEELCRAAAWLLPSGGRLCLCWRPGRLVELLCAMRAHGVEPKRLRWVCPRDGAAPVLMLVEGRRQGRPGLEVLPPLIRSAGVPQAIP